MKNISNNTHKVSLHEGIVFDSSYYNLISKTFDELKLPIRYALYNYIKSMQKQNLDSVSVDTFNNLQKFIEENYPLCTYSKAIEEYEKEVLQWVNYTNELIEWNEQLSNYNKQLVQAQEEILSNKWYNFCKLSTKRKLFCILSKIFKK